MTKNEFKKIFKKTKSEWDGDNAYQGLQIIAKYTEYLIQGAEHDVIFSEDIDVLIKKGIIKEDVTKLARLNWSIEFDRLICYV